MRNMRLFQYLTLLALLIFPTQLLADTDSVVGEDTLKWSNEEVSYINIVWTDPDGDGIAAFTTISITGYVFLAVTDPGAVAPTDNYDITVTDALGADIFGGELNNRDTANSESCVPKITTSAGSVFGSRFVHGAMTITITGNSQAGATGTLRIYTKDRI